MTSRQSMPRQWLIIDGSLGSELRSVVRRLPRASGILLLEHVGSMDAGKLAARLRRLASSRGFVIVEEEPRTAARVHNIRELRQALSRGTGLILLSPLYPTRSHPDWKPLPRMRAAALARLGGRKLVALGGMDEQRFRPIQHLGFSGWAGISAFRT
jgi:thiamine-phosphate pyrophosphorylase